MTKKNSVVMMTWISAILFCSLVAVCSFSPLADSGPKANKFGSLGMWGAIGVVLAFYILPLIFYTVGADAMRYVMAVLCGFGLLISLSILFVILGLYAFKLHDLIWVISLCIATLLVNIGWFFVAFRTKSTSYEAKL